MAQKKTSDLLTQLAFGELSNLKMGDPETGLIKDANIPQVLSAMNRSLSDIYTTVPLLCREVTIETLAHVQKYYLRQEHVIGEGSSTESNRYLSHRNGETFNTGLVKVLDVYDSVGALIRIGDETHPTPVYLPQFDCLQIRETAHNEIYYVYYQALPEELTCPLSDAVTPIDSNINLSPAIQDALLYLTASKIYSSMNGPAHEAKSAMLHQKYMAKMAELELRDSATTSEYVTNQRFSERGFI